MKEIGTEELLFSGGFIVLCVGIGLVHIPSALMVAGLLLMFLSMAIVRGKR
jgi:hypothetical protein